MPLLKSHVERYGVRVTTGFAKSAMCRQAASSWQSRQPAHSERG